MTNQLLLIETRPADERGRRPRAAAAGRAPGRQASGSRAPSVAPAGAARDSSTDPNEFRIDDRARTIARAGIAAARQALAEAVQRSAARDQQVAA